MASRSANQRNKYMIRARFREDTLTSRKVPSSFYGALTVEASNTLQPYDKPLQTMMKVGHIIDAVAAHQKPRIQDE